VQKNKFFLEKVYFFTILARGFDDYVFLYLSTPQPGGMFINMNNEQLMLFFLAF
jgi:hypothetical protein